MRLHGQRWEYRIGNTTVQVDNAFSWSLWTQERLLVNGELAHSSCGWFRFWQTYREPWLTALGEGELEVKLRSKGAAIICTARLDEAPLQPEATFEAAWTGAPETWPEQEEWKPG